MGVWEQSNRGEREKIENWGDDGLLHFSFSYSGDRRKSEVVFDLEIGMTVLDTQGPRTPAGSRHGREFKEELRRTDLKDGR